jgi:hypothetical protein
MSMWDWERANEKLNTSIGVGTWEDRLKVKYETRNQYQITRYHPLTRTTHTRNPLFKKNIRQRSKAGLHGTVPLVNVRDAH